MMTKMKHVIKYTFSHADFYVSGEDIDLGQIREWLAEFNVESMSPNSNLQ